MALETGINTYVSAEGLNAIFFASTDNECSRQLGKFNLLIFEAISCKQKHASRSTFLYVLCSCFVSVHCLIALHTE